MRAMDPALRDLALAHGGAVASRQATKLGITPLDLHRLAAAGLLRPVRRGAFVLPEAWTPLRPEARYALEARAILLSRSGKAWASHHCALAVQGLPLVGLDLTRFDVCAHVKRESRNGALTTHPLPPAEECQRVLGIPTVPVATALVQTTTRHGIKAAVVAGDAALHGGLLKPPDIDRAATRLTLGPRARQQVAAMTRLLDAKSESPGESLTRLLLLNLGFRFESQVEVSDARGRIGRVDFLVGSRIVVEFDGLLKYEGMDGRAALVREKQREDRLRAAGYEVVRLVWADLEDPERVGRLLREAAARAHSPATSRR